MKKLILIASVAAVSVLASCASKKNCVCTDKDGKEISNTDLSSGIYSSASSSDRESICSALGIGTAFAGGKCELK